ncbi:MAG: winged helix transcriptional response regulator [Ramlibacter sp.]|nr:winged helix transcriptional response regulator [Ramlibacter sp.]
MRVLLVEDDRMVGSALEQALKDAAYAVDWVTDGGMALSALATQPYELVVLDLGLPRTDGLQVLERLRGRGDSTPVLIVTARDAVQSRVAGLDLGADDYLVKPFESTELLARLRALSRRHGGSALPLLGNGALSLDPATKVASLGEKSARLSPREFALLQALLQRPGTVLSRAELEERIYGWGEEVESNTVEFLIHSLRRKLGAEAIRNVRGMGWYVDRAT